MIKDFLRIAELSPDDLERLLDLSAEFKADPENRGKPLDGETDLLRGRHRPLRRTAGDGWPC